MAVNRKSKGQAFMVGAVIFSGLLLLATVPSGPELLDSSGSDFRKFFQQSLDESINAFNDALSDGKSIENAKQGLYSYNRFLLESSSNKGIEFSSYQLVVLPDEGEALIINYRDSSLKANLSVNGNWTNTTIEPKQYNQTSFTDGKADVTLILPEMNDEYSFLTHKPRLVYWMKMEGDDESWQNSIFG